VKFTSKLFLPVINKEIRYCNITNKHHLELLKFVKSNDDSGLYEYLEWVLSDILKDKEDYNKLTSVEKFLILLDLRGKSVGDMLQLNTNNNIKIDYSITGIINNVINGINKLNLKKKIEFDNFSVELSIPKKLILDNIDDIYKEIINTIVIDDQIVNFSCLTEEEKDSIISALPAEISGEIYNFFNLNEDFNKIYLIAGKNNIGLDPISLNLYDKSMFYFIKTIFTDDLMNFYEMQYNVITKINVSYQQFCEMTPNECKIYINLYNRDMKKQEEANKTSMPSIPKFK
jgi:hypothetical protein